MPRITPVLTYTLELTSKELAIVMSGLYRCINIDAPPLSDERLKDAVELNERLLQSNLRILEEMTASAKKKILHAEKLEE